MQNEENESANIKTQHPLTPQQDNRMFESIPVRPAPWSAQAEVGSAMNKDRALNMFRTSNQWLYDKLAEGAGCLCGNCCLCAYNFLAGNSSDSARRAAEELERGNWLLSDVTPEEREEIVTIISKHFAATPAADDAESLLTSEES